MNRESRSSTTAPGSHRLFGRPTARIRVRVLLLRIVSASSTTASAPPRAPPIRATPGSGVRSPAIPRRASRHLPNAFREDPLAAMRTRSTYCTRMPARRRCPGNPLNGMRASSAIYFLRRNIASVRSAIIFAVSRRAPRRLWTWESPGNRLCAIPV